MLEARSGPSKLAGTGSAWMTLSVFSTSSETISCCFPSSDNVKSSFFKSRTKLPFLSRTETFTKINSVSVRNVNFCDAAIRGNNDEVSSSARQILFISIKTGNARSIESFASTLPKLRARMKMNSDSCRCF